MKCTRGYGIIGLLVVVSSVLRTAMADDPQIAPNKLDTFQVDGNSLSMPLTVFKERNPQATLDNDHANEAEKTVCYSTLPVGGINRVRFNFSNDRLSTIEMAFPAAQLAENGGQEGLIQKLTDEFGPPDRTTTVPELGSISFWAPASSQRRAELASFAEGALLTVMDTSRAKAPGPPRDPEAFKQFMNSSVEREDKLTSDVKQSLTKMRQQQELLKKTKGPDYLITALSRVIAIVDRQQQQRPTTRAIVQRIIDGDLSQETTDAQFLSTRLWQWQVDDLRVANLRLTEAIVRSEEEEKDRVRVAEEKAIKKKPVVKGITEWGYNALRIGMYKFEVDEVLGDSGSEHARSGRAVIYNWRNGGKVISATFIDGQLHSKAQFGLE